MEDKGPLIIIVCWTFTAIALLFVALRLYVRIHIQRKLQSDDGWILLGTVYKHTNLSTTTSSH